MYTGANILRGALYSTKLCCASIDALYERLEPVFKRVDYDKKCVISKLAELLEVSSSYSAINSENAMNILIANDLKKIIKTIKEVKIENPEGELKNHYEMFIKNLIEHNIDLSFTSFKIVDTFPPPYHKQNFWAMNYDTYDEKEFNIPVGIALKREFISPIFSTVLLAHELVHASFGTKHLPYLARGLEDGISDFIGYLFLSYNVIGSDMSKNSLINSRFFFPPEQDSEIYVENLREALILYQLYGMEGLFEILRLGMMNGRTAIKRLEKKCILGDYSNLELPRGDWKDDLIKFCHYIIGFPRSLVVSPLAYYLAKKIEIGLPIAKILKDWNIEPKDGKKALRELQSRVYLVLINKNKIVSDETKTFLNSNCLRYEINKFR